MKKQNDYKSFLIKLASISIAIVIVINLLFNLIFAERLEKIDKALSLNKSQTRSEIKQKIRNEISRGLAKENMIAEEDKILATPTLSKILPPPVRRIIGDLSDREKVLIGLDLLFEELSEGDFFSSNKENSSLDEDKS